MKQDKECLFSLADIGFHVRWSQSKARFFHDPCYNGFLFRAGSDIDKISRTLKHRTLIDVGYHEGNPLPRSGGINKILELPRHWALHATDRSYYLERFYPPTNRRLSVSVIQKDFSKVRFHPEKKSSWSFRYLLQPLIRYLLINILALNEGVMLHAATIKIGDRAFIFSGRSGIGKTTISRLFRAAGLKVLTDESTVICKRAGRLYAYGTPWPGEGRVSAADCAPIGAICFISHGKENSLRKVEAKPAAKNILREAVVQTWDPAMISGIIDSANSVAANTPCFEMPFVKDESVVKFVLKNLVTEQKEGR